MKLLSIRYCETSPQVEALAGFFDALGVARRPLPAEAEGFNGAIFPAGDSWIEMRESGPQMPAGVMLQLVVDDADAFAARARAQGLALEGPMDAHGEHIYFTRAPNGMQVSFQSAL